MNRSVIRIIQRTSILLLLLLAVSLIKAPKAQAACGDNARLGNRTGTSTSLGGMVVQTRWRDLGGAYHDFNTNVSVHSSDTHGLTQAPAGSENGQYSWDLSFNTGSTYYQNSGNSGPCNTTGYLVFGYGTTAADGTGNYGNTWTLDCKNSAGQDNLFRVDVGAGPSGVNGHWENDAGAVTQTGANFTANNADRAWRTFTFVEDPQAPPPTTQVQGHIFKADNNGNITGEVTGASIETCGWGGSLFEGSPGYYYFNVNNGAGFCFRITGNFPSGYDGPFLRPFGEGYTNQSPSCPGYGGGSYNSHCPNPPYATINSGVQSGYEYQAAGTNAGNGYDRGRDDGYDIVFVQQPAATSLIQGRKVIGSTAPFDSGASWPGNNAPGNANVAYTCCTLSGNQQEQTGNPYFYNNLPKGLHRVAIKSVPAGWELVGYTLCYDNNNCHTNTPTAAVPNPDAGAYNGMPSALIDTTNRGYADLYWHFRPIERPPTGNITSYNCSTVRATATDPDNGAQLNLKLYVDGRQVATGRTSGGSITFNYSPNWEPYQDTGGHTIRVDAESVNSSGTGTGVYSQIGSSASVGPCLRATCQSITVNGGAPIEKNTDFEVQVRYTNTGEIPLKADPATNPIRVGITDGVNGTADIGDKWVPMSNATSGFTLVAGDPHARLAADVPINTDTPIIKFTLHAPNSLTNQPLFPRLIYDNSTGSKFFGTACSGGSVTTYQRFNFGVHVTSVVLDDTESPANATANYGIDLDISTPVSASSTQRIYKKDASGSIIGSDFGNRDQPGPYSNNQTIPYSKSVSGVSPGEKVCGYIILTPKTGLVDSSGNIAPNSGSGSVADENCSTVAYKPYFKLYGGDTLVGGAFKTGTSCNLASASKNPDLKGWLKPTTVDPTSTSGAGVQFAIIALGKVDQVSSAMLRTSAPLAPKDLTLANINPVGGDFTGTPGAPQCIPDYFGTTQGVNLNDKGLVAPPNNVVDVKAILTNDKQTKYKISSPNKLILTSGNQTSNSIGNLRHTIYVDGDVVIQKNLTYGTGWSFPGNVPYFTVVAKGNIYIDKLVTRIDGLYIAQPRDDNNDGQPDNHTGIIYTCSENNGSLVADAQVYGECYRQLLIRGSFIAQTSRLLRTFGTLKNASVRENKTARNDCLNNNALTGSSCAAEVFDPGPEIFVGRPVFTPRTDSKGGNYDSYGGLPIIL